MRNGNIFGSRMTRKNGLCATNQLQQEYGTMASTSHTNTEPLALDHKFGSYLKLASQMKGLGKEKVSR